MPRKRNNPKNVDREIHKNLLEKKVAEYALQEDIEKKAEEWDERHGGDLTGGKVILTTPVDLLDTSHMVLNPEAEERERIHLVPEWGATDQKQGSAFRKFDGAPHKHCSGCPFPEGCVVCLLP